MRRSHGSQTSQRGSPRAPPRSSLRGPLPAARGSPRGSPRAPRLNENEGCGDVARTDAINGSEINFYLAVQLLVKAHEREIQFLAEGKLKDIGQPRLNLNTNYEDVNRQTTPEDPEEAVRKGSRDSIREDEHNFPRPRTSVAKFRGSAPIDAPGETPADARFDSENGESKFAKALKTEKYPTAKAKLSFSSGCGMDHKDEDDDSDDLDTQDAKKTKVKASVQFGEDVASSSVVHRWMALVSKVLGFHRDPFEALPGWKTSHEEAHGGSVAKGRSSCTSRTLNDRQNSTIINVHKMALERIEGGIVTHGERRSSQRKSHSMHNLALNFKGANAVCCWTVVRPKQFMLHPTSSKKLLWVLGCMMMLAYEVFLVTMTPFGLSEEKWAKDLDVICASFWSLDIGLNFRSGIFIAGKVEMNSAVVANVYLRTWFLFDCAIAGIQWYSVYEHLVDSGNTANSLAAFAMLRVLRFGRVTRMLKRFNFEDAVLSSIGTTAHHMADHFKLTCEIGKCLFGALLFVHLTACLWYEVGKGRDGWATEYGFLLKNNAWHDYLVCMHWALSQFQGSVDVYPGRSTLARVFACVSSCLSIVFFSLFVSTLTGTLVSIREERKRRLHDIHTMSRCLDRHAVPTELLLRASHYINTFNIQQGERLKRSEDRKALELFPKGLRRQLISVIFSPHLRRLPIFTYLKEFHAVVHGAVCMEAITQHMFASDEDLFLNREPSKHSYVIISGEITYNSEPVATYTFSTLSDNLASHQSQDMDKDSDSSPDGAHGVHVGADEETSNITEIESPGFEPEQDYILNVNKLRYKDRKTIIQHLGSGDIVSEAALWVPCNHEGDLSCMSISQCLVLDSTRLLENIHLHDVPYLIFSDYAHRFARAAEHITNDEERRMYIDLLGAKDVLLFEINGTEA